MHPASPVAAARADGEALAAADGIDEAITLWLATHRPPAEHAGGRVVALRAAGREGRVGLHERVIDRCDGALPHARVLDTASELDLWLWGRMGHDVLRVEGPIDVVRTLRGAIAVATG